MSRIGLSRTSGTAVGPVGGGGVEPLQGMFESAGTDALVLLHGTIRPASASRSHAGVMSSGHHHDVITEVAAISPCLVRDGVVSAIGGGVAMRTIGRAGRKNASAMTSW